MQLFLMRHGEAGFDAQTDKERTLTDNGRYETALMSQWLVKSVERFDLILVSPYLRAQQTWQEVSKHFKESTKWMTIDELTPCGEPQLATDIIFAYAEQYQASKVLVISHMPLLGYLVSEMVAGIEPPLFATSGIACIEKKTKSSLKWQQSPRSI